MEIIHIEEETVHSIYEAGAAYLHSYRRGVEQRALHLRINIELFRRIRIEALPCRGRNSAQHNEACVTYLHSYRRGVEQFGSSLGS